MKKMMFAVAAALSILLLTFPLGAADNKEAPAIPSIEMSHVVTATAKVAAVDQEKRTVTLQGPEKNVTVKVEDWVDLEKIKSGDTVDVIYYESVSARVYKKQEEQRSSHLQKIQYKKGSASGPQTETAAARDIEISGTVQSIDARNNIVVIEDPAGNLKAHKLKDPKNLEKMEEGDSIAVDFLQAIAVSVEKARKTD